jgi:hypothetical protein
MTRGSHTVRFSRRHRNYTTTAQINRNRNRTRRLKQTPYRATGNSSSERLAKNLLPQINKAASAPRATRRTTLALATIARNINQQTRARTAAAERAATAPAREAARARTAERKTAKREAAAAKRAAKKAAALEAFQRKKRADAEAAAAAAVEEGEYMNDFHRRSEETQREKIAAAMARRAAEADAAARAALEEVDKDDLADLSAAFARM